MQKPMKACQIAIFFALVFLCLPKNPSAREISVAQYGNWFISANMFQNRQVFRDCNASIMHPSGFVISFSFMSRSKWLLAFKNENWNLTEGAIYEVSYAIDGNRARSGRAEAADAKFIVIELPPENSLFQQFRNGSRISVNFPFGPPRNRNMTFDLTDTSVILSTLLHCAESRGEIRFPSTSRSTPR